MVRRALLLAALLVGLVAAACGPNGKPGAAGPGVLHVRITNHEPFPILVTIVDNGGPPSPPPAPTFNRAHGPIAIPASSSKTIRIAPVPLRLGVLSSMHWNQQTRSRQQDYRTGWISFEFP